MIFAEWSVPLVLQICSQGSNNLLYAIPQFARGGRNAGRWWCCAEQTRIRQGPLNSCFLFMASCVLALADVNGLCGTTKPVVLLLSLHSPSAWVRAQQQHDVWLLVRGQAHRLPDLQCLNASRFVIEVALRLARAGSGCLRPKWPERLRT